MTAKKAATTLADRLRAELTKALARIEALERERDRFGSAWSSAEYEAAAFRRQRDEILSALLLLSAVVDTLGPARSVIDEDAAYRLGTAREISRTTIEKYRPPATIETP